MVGGVLPRSGIIIVFSSRASGVHPGLAELVAGGSS